MQIGTALNTVEQLVEDQELDPLHSEKWVFLILFLVMLAIGIAMPWSLFCKPRDLMLHEYLNGISCPLMFSLSRSHV